MTLYNISRAIFAVNKGKRSGKVMKKNNRQKRIIMFIKITFFFLANTWNYLRVPI